MDEGVEIDLAMVESYHNWIDEYLTTPCGLLINKLNKYTYTFKAQLKIADLTKIKSTAVVNYSRVSEVATQSLAKLPREEQLNIRLFSHREGALEWLRADLAN